MAPIATELAILRAITWRISSISTPQLPQQIPSIAANLTNCRSLLSSNQTTGPKTSTEASVAVHKYRTLLATLLQDRTAQGRWAAIVLIKATIEVGGWETLQKSLPWVRGLLGILAKPDPPLSKKLCIITLTRIFVLTREYPTLVREITTPSLPTFVQTCIQLAPNVPASLLQTILESFNQLLPRHPTIFRSYLKQLNQLLTRTIAPTPSTKLSAEQDSGPRYQTTFEVCTAARQLYTQLPNSAPKGASTGEWQSSFKKTVENAHRVADKVFRAVVEDWKPSLGEKPNLNGHTLDDEVQDLEVDSMNLPPWSGIYAGGERLVNQLRLLEAYIQCSTAGPVTLEVGAISDLLMRVLALNVPSSSGSKDDQNYVRFNNQVSKEERENLWLILPDVHVAAIEVLLTLARRSDNSSTSVDVVMLDQLVMVFTSEKNAPQIRTACYRVIAQLLERSGAALPKSSVEPLGPVIRACCDDILPVEKTSPPKQSNQQGKTNSTQQALTNADTFLSSSKGIENHVAQYAGLQEAAHSLLVALCSSIPHHLSDSLRTRLDRTAALQRHKDTLLSSYLNPAPSRKFGKPAASVLPLLARLHAGERDVEALIRPRMPVIRIGNTKTDSDDEGESEMEVDEENEDEAEEALDAEETEPFVGQELDILLQTDTQANTQNKDVQMDNAPTEPAPLATPIKFNGTAPTLSNPSTTDRITRSATAKKETVTSGNKRPQDPQSPLSPTKRFKRGDAAAPLTSLAPVTVPISVADAQTTSTTTCTTTSTGPSDTKTITTNVSAVAQPSVPAAEGEDDSDDEDDVVPLVLGQDTDDESD